MCVKVLICNCFNK